uniref:Uncharacterized protein n=1 Tax=Triticum urartu TaxID=4572 RepID=A0A8R7NYU8_TRIUA
AFDFGPLATSASPCATPTRRRATAYASPRAAKTTTAAPTNTPATTPARTAPPRRAVLTGATPPSSWSALATLAADAPAPRTTDPLGCPRGASSGAPATRWACSLGWKKSYAAGDSASGLSNGSPCGCASTGRLSCASPVGRIRRESTTTSAAIAMVFSQAA